MTNPNLTLLEAAVRLLEPLLDELVFVGGCATGLLITDPAAEGIRPTYDVDAITEVASYGQYADLSKRLRARQSPKEGCSVKTLRRKGRNPARSTDAALDRLIEEAIVDA